MGDLIELRAPGRIRRDVDGIPVRTLRPRLRRLRSITDIALTIVGLVVTVAVIAIIVGIAVAVGFIAYIVWRVATP